MGERYAPYDQHFGDYSTIAMQPMKLCPINIIQLVNQCLLPYFRTCDFE